MDLIVVGTLIPGALVLAWKCFRFLQFVTAYGRHGGPPNERRQR